jgi:hypothetical protein
MDFAWSESEVCDAGITLARGFIARCEKRAIIVVSSLDEIAI